MGAMYIRFGRLLVLATFVGSMTLGCIGPQGPPGPPAFTDVAAGGQVLWRCTYTCDRTDDCLPAGTLTVDQSLCANNMAEDTGLRVR